MISGTCRKKRNERSKERLINQTRGREICYIPRDNPLLTRLCLSSSDALTKLATLTCNLASLFISSWACCLLSATWAAITFCRSEISMHLLQRQLRHWQARLCPFSHETIPWFLHLAHFGARGGFVSGDNKLGGESGKCMKLGPSMLISNNCSASQYSNKNLWLSFIEFQASLFGGFYFFDNQ